MSNKDDILHNIVPEAIDLTPVASWNIEQIPGVIDKLPKDQSAFNGSNNILSLIDGFRGYVKTKSSRTKAQYEWDIKQFLLWCNDVRYAVMERVTTTAEMRDVASTYDQVLKRHGYMRNTVALKMQGVRSFFEWMNSRELKMDMRAAFNPKTVSTSDPNAYKRQPRINDEVYDEVMAYVHKNGTFTDKWIFFFLAQGCRKIEIVNVKVSDIDMINREVRVFMRKVNDTRSVKLPIWFTGMHEFATGQGFIVKYEGKDYEDYAPDSKKFKKLNNKSQQRKLMNGKVAVNEQYIYDKVNRWIKNTKYGSMLNTVGLHAFRRYFVNFMIRKGYSDTAIAAYGGWKNTALISKYGHEANMENNPIRRDGAVVYDPKMSKKKPDEPSEENPE